MVQKQNLRPSSIDRAASLKTQSFVYGRECRVRLQGLSCLQLRPEKYLAGRTLNCVPAHCMLLHATRNAQSAARTHRNVISPGANNIIIIVIIYIYIYIYMYVIRKNCYSYTTCYTHSYAIVVTRHRPALLSLCGFLRHGSA